MINKRKILVTAALPYSNGDIHLGHLLEYIQADIWVRFQKLRGNTCHFFCADDTHGTPVMLSAQKMNVSPEELVLQKQKEHQEDFSNFEINFTHYSSTNTKINQKISAHFYQAMLEKKHISKRVIKQMYCENCSMFLPDRFIRGECPNCKAKDQYGDSCESCGYTYSAEELINPKCATCENPPIRRASEHIFFELNHFKDFLSEWIPQHVSSEVKNKLLEWFDQDLRSWDISRDKPYFGFLIPGYEDKYFYVWVDAPIGYIASTQEWLEKKVNSRNSQGQAEGEAVEENVAKNEYEKYWKNETYEIYHFIGKDIIYFHSLFWPAMLKTAGFSTPKKIFVHGFLTLNGQKMSKSKKIFINAKDYLKVLPPLYIRYYLASKISPSLSDIDINLEDFKNKINSELVGKLTNLASRSMKLLEKYFALEVKEMSPSGKETFTSFVAESQLIAEYYEAREFAKVVNTVREWAEKSNRYFDEKKPWVTLKGANAGEANAEVLNEIRSQLTDVINFFRQIVIVITPILPSYSLKVNQLFKEEPYNWDDIKKPLVNCTLSSYEHLSSRITDADIKNLL